MRRSLSPGESSHANPNTYISFSKSQPETELIRIAALGGEGGLNNNWLIAREICPTFKKKKGTAFQRFFFRVHPSSRLFIKSWD